MRFLVVEDDPHDALAEARVLRGEGAAVTIAKTFREGAEQLQTTEYDGLLVDVGLPDGDGIDLLTTPRRSRPEAAALVISGAVDNERLRRAHEGGARFLVKPAPLVNIQLFVFRVRMLRRGGHDRIAAQVERWVAAYRLTAAEAEILERRAAGVERSALATLRNASPATVNNQVKSLLKKTGDSSLDEAVSRLLRESLDDWISGSSPRRE